VRKKLALLGLTLAVLALALWFALSRGTSSVAPVANESATSETGKPAATATVGASEEPRETRAEANVPSVHPSQLRVRSSAGIPLAFVEIEREGKWERVDLVDGGVDATTAKLPAQLRAPGHVARPLEKAEGELLLEPDALLVIGGSELRSCLVEWVIEDDGCKRLDDWREARTRAIAADWISDTSFGIAVACDRLEPLPSQLQVRLVRADRLRTYITLEPKPGMRGRWEMPCTGTRAGTPLEVRVERTAATRGPVTVVLDCPAQPGTSATPAAFRWGSVMGFGSDLSEELTIAAGEDVARFPFALQGRHQVVAAIDEASHAYGRIEFVHDGSLRTLELRPALEIRGRIVEAESRLPLRNVHLFCFSTEAHGWGNNGQEQKLDREGRFVLYCPTRALANTGTPLDPPRTFNLMVQAPGYDNGGFQFERTEPLVLDMGEIALGRHKNRVVLAAGHGLSEKVLDGQYIVFGDKPEDVWGTLPAALLEDGRLEIELNVTYGSAGATNVAKHGNLLTGTERLDPFDRPLGAILFVHVVDDVRSFRLESDGLYHRLPEEKHKVTLHTEGLAPGGKSWRIGWSWNGAWISAGMLASRVVGQEVDVQVTIPAGAQQLWWSSTGIPPDLHGDPGGFQEITGSSMKVVLR
jgi:hypothetical protein